MFLDLHRKFKITNDISISTVISVNKSDNNEFDYTTLEYVLHTSRYGLKTIEEFLQVSLEKYTHELRSVNPDNP